MKSRQDILRRKADVCRFCDAEAARARKQVEQEAHDADRWCFVTINVFGFHIPFELRTLKWQLSSLPPRWHGDRYGAKEEWEENQKLQAQGR